MNSVFSVDDFSDPFWQTPSPVPPMNRSPSQWAFDKLLEEFSTPATSFSASAAVVPSAVSQLPKTSSNPDEEVVEIKKPLISHPQLPDRNPKAVSDAALIDSEEYCAFLKNRLDLACAAVAQSGGFIVKPEGNSELQSLVAASSSPLGSQGIGHDISTVQSGAESGSTALPELPSTQQKQDIQVRQTTSGSSREDSDDDEVDGETETNEHADPADAKRARRMQSNRESARRSRRRKQAQVNELETQVGQLRDESTSLLSRYTDINKKCDNAAVDNRILKANIETLRTKVKMAEEQVKRVTGINPMLLARSNMPGMGMQFVGSQLDVPTNACLPMQPPNSNQFFHQPVPSIPPATPQLQRLSGSFPDSSTLVSPVANMQRENRASNVCKINSIDPMATGQSIANVPSMPRVQRQIHDTVGPGGALPVCESQLSHGVAKDNKRK